MAHSQLWQEGRVGRVVREEGAEVKEIRPLGQSLEQHRKTVFVSLSTAKVHSNQGPDSILPFLLCYMSGSFAPH